MNYSLIVLILFVQSLFTQNLGAQKQSDNDFTTQINKEREIKNIEYSDSLKSPLAKEDLKVFKGLFYFEPDESYRVISKITFDTLQPPFKMPTSTNRLPEYRVYGYLDFVIKDTLCRLTAYQNLKNGNEPADYLFVPFRDASNETLTYRSGRYIDLPIPDTDSILIDFNSSCNPYCAYDKRWSCPLVPSENWLKISILAGEMRFK